MSLRRSILFFILVKTSRSRAVVCQGVKNSHVQFRFVDFWVEYNEVNCHSLKLYPFLFSKIIMVSQNLDYFSRKVTLFLKYPTVTVKIIPSSLKFSSLCWENKAFNYSYSLSILIQCQSKGKKQNKLTSSRQTSSLKGWKIISEAHDASKMAM